jgi:adenosylcobyric acid synthase
MNGKLFVVGIGPGDSDHLTPAAQAALQQSEVIAGYKTYLDLIPDLLVDKEILSSGMRQEVDRCRAALACALNGQTVALVSGGDAGIYGMAGLALELAADQPVEVEIIPGISALQAAAARLGAPLMHDFAVISLSDLLTPWETIQKRIEAAAAADFVVALYNPRSKQRTWQLEVARNLLLQHRDSGTPVGIVRHACRKGEEIQTATLADLPIEDVDMFSLVIIGNSATRIDGRGRMVTPRGYDVRSEKRPSSLAPHSSPGPDKKCRALFIGGTGSDVGKSVIAAGLCRLLHRQGVRVAPFKAQNMALNSAVTPQGGEIGRAQALQAVACGLEPHVDMNPILLKPNSDTGSQVIVAGRPVGNMSVTEYHAFKEQAFSTVQAAFARLSETCQVVVMEGAGSIAEINLKRHDITNLRAAEMAGAPVLLVADIDRGGVFASIVGTLALLDASERQRVKGVIINRFRGDATLLEPGLAELERRTGVPVLGVIPWIDLRLPEEDSVALNRKPGLSLREGLRIGVVRLPKLSNYTDFDPLEHEPGVALSYISQPQELADQDLVILPGSKSVMADLASLRETGLAEALLSYHADGGRMIGVCGGYQMLGKRILDPDGVESSCPEMDGLGLLDVVTVLTGDKQTHQVICEPMPAAEQLGLVGIEQVSGYEIHMGETQAGEGVKPLFRLRRRSGQSVDQVDGAIDRDGRVWGTYLHGLFDDDRLRNSLLVSWGVVSNDQGPCRSLESELDRLATHLENHVDTGLLWGLLECDPGQG